MRRLARLRHRAKLGSRLAGLSPTAWWRTWALASVLAIAALWFAPGAIAKRHGGHGAQATPASKEAPRKGGHSNPLTEASKSIEDELLAPGSIGAAAGKALGESGQVDPISGLGLRSPVCDRPSEIRSREIRLNCEANGTPEGKYPATNYGFDVFIDTGIDAPEGTFVSGFVMILNGVWLGLINVLKLVFEVLGLAFGLNPFTNGKTMHAMAATLERVYSSITDPWLSVAVVAGGICFAYKGLVRREVAGSVMGTLAAIGMLVAGLWVVHQPRASVGRLADLSNQMAVATVSAPQPGSLSRPMGSFAEALSHAWARLVEIPFAGLNFSDANWALSKPPAKAVEVADEKFCDDVGALALVAAAAHANSEEAKSACSEFARKRYGKPRRVIDLYLRSSPGSPARDALWQLFDHEEADKYKAKVAAQGGDGVLTRLSMLALFAVGLIGPLLLLAWLAIRLFTQAAVAFLLLLAAPFALFFPLLGDAGRRAFKTWGVTLLGAIVAKVVYGAFLSLVLLGVAILGGANGTIGFLLAIVFMWAIYLKRSELVGWMRIGGGGDPRGSFTRMGEIAGLAIGARLVGSVGGALRGVGHAGAEGLRGRARRPRGAGGPTKAALGEHALGVAEFPPGAAKPPIARDAPMPAGASSRGQDLASGSPGRPRATGAGPLVATSAAAPRERPTGAPSEPAAPRASASEVKGEQRKSPSPQGREVEDARHSRADRGTGRSDRNLRRIDPDDRRQQSRGGDPPEGPRGGGVKFEGSEGGAPKRGNQGDQKPAREQVSQQGARRLAEGEKPAARVVGRGRQAGDGIPSISQSITADRRAHLADLKRADTGSRPRGPEHMSRGGS